MAERRPPPEQVAHVRGRRDRPVRFLILDIEVALSGGQVRGVVCWRAWFASLIALLAKAKGGDSRTYQ
jgi:hypothetical protein